LQVIDLKTVDMQYHVYRLDLEGQQTEVMEGDGEDLPAASHGSFPPLTSVFFGKI
jgi:hypothetical protein